MISDFVVRAITFFTGKVAETRDLDNELEKAEEVLLATERALKEAGYEVFTKRISLPGIEESLVSRLLDHVGREVLISLGYSRSLSPEKVVELAESGVYVPVLHPGEPSFEYATMYSRIFHKASSRDPLSATRIAVGFHGEDFQTPYFPDSSSRGRRCIGLAFLYSKRLVKLLSSGLDLETSFRQLFSEIERVVEVVERVSGLPVLVDYSLSPWMENSVGELYEVSGYSLLEPGAQYFTWLLNKTIWKCSKPSLRTGFNEVMLPYAEDNVLRDYGAKGLVRARDFVAYTSTCVAGVDMVVVPENVTGLAQLIASAMAVAYVKSRPLSLRAVPVPAKPGELYSLGRFGRVPTIPY